MGVCQQQDARMALAVRAGLAFAHDGFELRAFFGTQPDVMLFLWHHSHLYTKMIGTS